MNNISLKEQKLLQLDILKDIHRFCIEKKLNYTLAYGTLIGAIRHKGYIPWDDDIDIAMPRSDYEKFIREYNHDIYKVHCLDKDSDYLRAFAKVEDSRTLIKEEGHSENLGVFVDVFPLDPLFDSPIACKKLFRKITFYRRLLAFRLLTSCYFKGWKRLLFCLGKPLLAFLPKRKLVMTIDNLTKSGLPDASYWGMFAGSVKYAIIEKEDLRQYELHKFEDTEFQIITNYDNWLRQVYGDYMTPPPIEQQKSVHYFNSVYWKI